MATEQSSTRRSGAPNSFSSQAPLTSRSIGASPHQTPEPRAQQRPTRQPRTAVSLRTGDAAVRRAALRRSPRFGRILGTPPWPVDGCPVRGLQFPPVAGAFAPPVNGPEPVEDEPFAGVGGAGLAAIRGGRA